MGAVCHGHRRHSDFADDVRVVHLVPMQPPRKKMRLNTDEANHLTTELANEGDQRNLTNAEVLPRPIGTVATRINGVISKQMERTRATQGNAKTNPSLLENPNDRHSGPGRHKLGWRAFVAVVARCCRSVFWWKRSG